MKTILLYGGTGRTGKLIIEYALKQGYKIKTLARNPDKIILKSEYLTVVKGTPTNREDVDKSMQGCDFVISTLSALSLKESMSFKKMEAPHTLENAIKNSIQVMNCLGIKRIVTLSSIGAGNSFSLAPWYMRLFIKISNFKIVFADHNAQEKLLMQSDLDWTIARPVSLTDETDIKPLVISFDKTPSPFKMSRKHLAKFMVDTLEQKEFIKKAVILSEK